MTENEFLKDLKKYQGILKAKTRINAGVNPEIALDAITQAIDIIQQYRAIGTVEDIEKSMQNVSVLLAENEVLKLYQAIGTIEEFKALKGKSVAKKPKMIGYRKDGEAVYECGCCGSTLKVADQPFCMICSCKVDWQCKLPAN